MKLIFLKQRTGARQACAGSNRSRRTQHYHDRTARLWKVHARKAAGNHSAADQF